MGPELVTLAISASTVLVGAMVTDSWTVTRNKLVSLWRSYRPDQVSAVEAALEREHGELSALLPDADPDRRGQLVGQVEAQWQTRLRSLLEDHPEASAALTTLIQQARSAVVQVHGDQVINITTLAPVPSRVRPCQLPNVTRQFVGRVAEIEALSALMEDARHSGGMVVVSAIGGMAGIGKTTLAVHWARQVADRYPDGQLYVNLRGFEPSGSPLRPEEAIRGFLDAFGVEPSTLPASAEAQAALFRSLVAGRQVLVVLDNARDTDHVRPILPGSSSCMVIVTSRNQLTGLVTTEGAYPLMLDLLSADEARELMVRHLGTARVDAEPAAAADIIDGCARLPLALGIVAARAAASPGLPLAVLAAELDEARGVLDALDAGDTMTDVRAVFSWSYDQLPAPRARLFRLLGVHTGPDISVAAVSSLVGSGPGPVRKALDALARAHLITQRAPGRYVFHDLLRTYAAEQAETVDPPEERTAALRRVVEHYLYSAHHAALLIDPHRVPLDLPRSAEGVRPETFARYDDALAWCAAEHPVLLVIVAQAAASGLDDVSFGALGSLHRVVMVERMVPDELWELFQRVVPPAPSRPQGGGRRRYGDREVLAAIIFVATTGCTWRQLPPVFGPSGPTAHRRFTEWSAARVWAKLHRLILDELGSRGKLDWSRCAIDSVNMRALKGGT